MINQNSKLNPKIFDKDVEQLPIRKGFGEGQKSNENIIYTQEHR